MVDPTAPEQEGGAHRSFGSDPMDAFGARWSFALIPNAAS